MSWEFLGEVNTQTATGQGHVDSDKVTESDDNLYYMIFTVTATHLQEEDKRDKSPKQKENHTHCH